MLTTRPANFVPPTSNRGVLNRQRCHAECFGLWPVHSVNFSTRALEPFGCPASLHLFRTSDLLALQNLPSAAWPGARLHNSRVLQVFFFIFDVSGGMIERKKVRITRSVLGSAPKPLFSEGPSSHACRQCDQRLPSLPLGSWVGIFSRARGAAEDRSARLTDRTRAWTRDPMLPSGAAAAVAPSGAAINNEAARLGLCLWSPLERLLLLFLVLVVGCGFAFCVDCCLFPVVLSFCALCCSFWLNLGIFAAVRMTQDCYTVLKASNNRPAQ